MEDKFNTRKLFRIALLTSPLIALFSFMPMIIIDNRLISNMSEDESPYQKLFGIAFITAIVFLLWLINIGLFEFFEIKKLQLTKHRFLRYMLSFLSCIILVTIVSNLPKPPNAPIMPSPGFGMKIFPFIGVTANNIMLLIILDLIVLRDRKAKMEIEITNLKLSNVVAQKEQLKGQIHPHFLFNSLSTLKTLMKKDTVDAEKYLINLSNFLRSSISYAGEDKTTLENEVQHCVEYLEMQKVRFNSSLNYSIDIPSGIKKTSFLPVFSLQMLAENAIKHNVLTKEEPLTINIYCKEDFNIRVENSLNLKPLENTTKLGLENLRKRVDLLSHSQKELKIEKTEEYFCVLIPLIDK